MENQQYRCTRCGNSFNIKQSFRCPRCYEPVLIALRCSGSCSKCSSIKKCNKN